MKILFNIFVCYLALLPLVSGAQTPPSNLNSTLQKTLDAHYQQYKNKEFFSGAALSFYVPGQPIQNFYTGQVAMGSGSPAVSVNTLFEIGSITKSFTAAIILQMQAEGKLKITNKLGDILPRYSKWSSITIEQLLNMTSGLPNYSDNDLFNAKIYSAPAASWQPEALVDIAYPPGDFAPPLKTTYFYSNTGYIVAEMIAAKILGTDFKTALTKRTIEKAQLKNTFYLDDSIRDRMAHGYNYNQYDITALVGKDTSDYNLEWAAGAGAVIANTEDIIHWVKALFIDNTILNPPEKTLLKSIISTATGKPIKQTSATDPKAFGLGVAQSYHAKIGRFWYYEGETIGFRALYMYVPCNHVIVASVFNSATNSENDHAGALLQKTYQEILQHYPKLVCKS